MTFNFKNCSSKRCEIRIMSRVPQKIMINIININFALWMRAPNVRGSRGGNCKLNADNGGRGSKIGKILRTSFMARLAPILKSKNEKYIECKGNCR